MAIPFGFSFGEVINGVGILRNAFTAIRESGNSRPYIGDVATALSDLHKSLDGVERFLYDASFEPQRGLMMQVISACQHCIERFVHQCCKSNGVSTKGSLWAQKEFQGAIGKIDWLACRKWDIEQFRKELLIHNEAVSSLLSTMLSTGDMEKGQLGRQINDIVATQHRKVRGVSKPSPRDVAKSTECLNALAVINPMIGRKEIESRTDRLVPKACDWILRNSNYRSMMESDQSELLWIHGQAGKGKTMLSMFLVDTLAKQVAQNPQDQMAYFFCDNNTDSRNSTLHALKTVLHQVLRQSSRNVLLEDFKLQGPQMFSTIEGVWNALTRVLEASVTRNLYIMIDGLDECTQESLDAFLKLASSYIADNADGICNVKWIFTSRNETRIEEYLKLSLVIDLEAVSTEVDQAVGTFIDSKVETLAIKKRFDAPLKQFVAEKLKQKAGGNFLYVSLACKELLKKNVSYINVKLVVNKMACGLDAMYARILEGICKLPEDELQQAFAVLRAVGIAFRPLSLRELAVMAGFPSDAIDNEDIVLDAVDSCGSLLTLHRDHPYFVHRSAKEYLFNHETAGVFSSDLEFEHEKAAMRALKYTTRDWKFYLESLDDIPLSSLQDQPSSEESLQYPLIYWIDHSNIAGARLQKSYALDRHFFRRNSDLRRTWLLYFKKHRHMTNFSAIQNVYFSALHISAVCGTWWVAEILLRHSSDHVDCEDSFGLTPLHWAVHCGQVNVARVLLQKGANANNKGGFTNFENGPREGTPLGLAVSYNNLEMSKLLLDFGADVDYPDHQSKTPLVWTILKDLPKSTKFLLQQGADPILRDDEGKTPLHDACAQGNETIAKILLNHGASAHAKDDNNVSPAVDAACRGHTGILKILDAYGATTPEADETGGWGPGSQLVAT
ncbi:ankyrin repeat protein [Rutstroemia sp. NJR-2017a WRK4]|nr:ankyrin repeat protein [Rutstroemia sp. NJR-2017a WRK4]